MKEIFQIDDIEDIINSFDKFADSIKNKYKNSDLEDFEDELVTEYMAYQYTYNLDMEKEKTKQMIEKTKQLELEIEFYKLKNNL